MFSWFAWSSRAPLSSAAGPGCPLWNTQPSDTPCSMGCHAPAASRLEEAPRCFPCLLAAPLPSGESLAQLPSSSQLRSSQAPRKGSYSHSYTVESSVTPLLGLYHRPIFQSCCFQGSQDKSVPPSPPTHPHSISF